MIIIHFPTSLSDYITNLPNLDQQYNVIVPAAKILRVQVSLFGVRAMHHSCGVKLYRYFTFTFTF